MKEGILYYQSRIRKENAFEFKDLDKNQVIDKHELKPYLPVMLKDSPVLYSLVASFHCRSTPHVGIERTVREVLKEVFVRGGLRDLLRKIKAECITCKRLDRTRAILEGVEVHADKAQIAGSRKGLIGSLRFRLVDRSILSDHSPNRIRVLKKLVLDWPTITSGGCRFLLQARSKFIQQMETLKKLNYSWRFGLSLQEISQELREYARFGIYRAELKKVIWNEEVLESGRFELLRPLSLEVR